MPSLPLRRALAFTASAAAVCALTLSSATAASAAIVPTQISTSAEGAALALTPLGTYESGVFDASAAEIVQTYRDRLYVVNAQAGTVEVLDNSDPENPVSLFEIEAAGTANSLAIRDDGLGVVAFEAEDKTANGSLVFFDANADTAGILGTVTVGALPDMVSISKDGAYAVVANEGEPANDYSSDPEGSISVVPLPATVTAPAQSVVRTAGFGAFEAGGTKPLDPKVRVFGPDVAAPGQDLTVTPLSANRVSRNLEPEYVAIDGTTAYVSLQEANAIAVVDLAKTDAARNHAPEVTGILPLGYKDYGLPGNGLDASDRDPRDAPEINITTYPGLKGLYMPDGIQAFKTAGTTYLVTANEGDSREWGFDEEGEENDAYFTDELRIKDALVCAGSPLAALQGDADLGRLKAVSDMGKTADGCYSEFYAYGGRSFSIWDTKGNLVFDSGDQFEQITADLVDQGLVFNASNDNNGDNDRSDDKGPEPENVTVGVVGGKTYAFVGLERVGGVMVYDITTPASATFVTYVNNRDFTADVETSAAGDLGPEGIQFIPALRSSTGTPQLVVGSEVSGTTTVWDVESLTTEKPDVQVLTINDFHGRIVQERANGYAGAAVLAGAVEKYRQANPNTIFASAGDNIGASAFESFILDDNPTIDALKAATLDVSAVGNHEFDQGFADLTDRVIPRFGGEEFALGANVYEKGTQTPALEPYTIETTESGARIAFIGVVTPSTRTLVNPAGIEDIEFGDMTEAVNREAAKIVAANEADVIIALVHDGAANGNVATITQPATENDFSDFVAGASDDVDAIVSGHTHQTYSHVIDGRPVIQANQYGSTLGTLDIDLGDDNELVSITPGVVPLLSPQTSDWAAYPSTTVAPIVKTAADEANVIGQQEVGTISADILRAKLPNGNEDRGSHSSLGNTVADFYLWATSQNPNYGGEDAQIAFMNPGGLRADLVYAPDGSVSYREAANVQPFGNTLVTLELTPAQIKAVLEEQWQPDGSTRPKLALGVSRGFTFEYDPNAARGAHITKMTLDGTDLLATDTTTKIRVVTNSFLAGGGDNFTTFRSGTVPVDSGQIDLAATIDYFQAIVGPVIPAPVDRAYLVGEQPGAESPEPVFEQPGTNPGGDPGTGPGTNPGTDPGANPGTTPAPGTGGTGNASGDLASTGTDGSVAWGWGAAGAFLLIAGGAALVIRRRRAQSTS